MSRVENAPVILVSANRSFVHRIDCQCKVEGTFTGRLGDRMALFLFNDCIEIARWKRETSADMVENEKTGKNVGSLGRNVKLEERGDKNKAEEKVGRMLFKHYKLLPLNSIKRVVTVVQEEENNGVENVASTKSRDIFLKLVQFLKILRFYLHFVVILWCLDIDPDQPSLEHSKINSLSPKSISSARHSSSNNLLKNGSESPRSSRSRPTSLQNTPELEVKHNTLTVFQANDQKSRDHWLSLLKFTET